MKITFLIILMSLSFSCSSNKTSKKESTVSTSSAKADISGKAAGEVTFKPSIQGVVMKVRVTGLSPNTTHGFHIHENGVCDKPGYKSAGEHFNPRKHSHGGPSASLKHLGDLGNLVANAKGTAEKEILMADLKDVNIINRKSIIVHEKPDDLSTQPSGNSGDRIACGVIGVQ